jgi:hypothetical protein
LNRRFCEQKEGEKISIYVDIGHICKEIQQLFLWGQKVKMRNFKHRSNLTALYKQITHFAICSIFRNKQMEGRTEVGIVKICEQFLTSYLVVPVL